jgi:hypothetical protein
LIAMYGRATLTNRNDGGEGGHNPSAETRQKLSLAKKGKIPWNKGIPPSEEQRKKLSIALKGRPLDPERAHFLRTNRLGRTWDRSSVELTRQKNLGQKRTAEQRAKMATGHRKGRTYMLVSPDGTVYSGIVCLSIFDEQYGLNVHGLRQVLIGKNKHHRGWKCYDDPA